MLHVKIYSIHCGGVFVLIHKNLSSVYIDTDSDWCETVWCKIILSNGSTASVRSFDRPPRNVTPEPFLTLSYVLSTLRKTYPMLGGDWLVGWKNRLLEEEVRAREALIQGSGGDFWPARQVHTTVAGPQGQSDKAQPPTAQGWECE